MTVTLPSDLTGFDPIQGEFVNQIWTAWMEQLFSPNWTEDPSVQNYQIGFWDNSFAAGGLLQSWEFTNPSTIVMHVRQGIHWQNIPPANGAELTANDIVYHFDRMCGLGDGFTTIPPVWAASVVWTYVKSVTATDNYTVVMNWSVSNPEYILENMEAAGASTSIENPAAVQLWGDVTDWHHAIGSGPFILKDYVSGSSANLVKNPNYWGTDERYPQNQLPYLDSLDFLIIPDHSTALAAMRSGKIDVLDNVSTTDVKNMQSTNPAISVVSVPGAAAANTIDPRNDKTPFDDIRVREALQMAIDLPTIASNYYNGTVSPDPSTLTSNYLTGWGFPYSQWPSDLQAQYAFNVPGAKALLTAAGYPNGFNTDIVVSSDADLSLLQVVQSYFSAINVNMSIRTMDPASFINYVSINRSQDALAMRANGELGLNYQPFIQLVRYQPTNTANYMNINDSTFNAALPDAMAATTTAQVKQIVQSLNEYVAQQHFVISLLVPPTYSFCQPWLKGFNAQYGATWGYSGPQLLYFYEARFWIVPH
jgi:peptide/nickel transport system substrate-binding protein